MKHATNVIAPILATLILVLLLGPASRWVAIALYVPVATKIEWISFKPDGGAGSRGWQLIEWNIEKLRDCEFKAMDWKVIRPDGALGDIDFEPLTTRRIVSRETGKHTGILTRVGSTLSHCRWRVTVLHDCHFALPDVRTVIWDGREDCQEP